MSKKLLLISLTVFIFVGAVFLVPAINVVSVSSRKNPSLRFYSSDAYRYGFIISYTHSVNKGRVHDYYRCTHNGDFVLESTHFVSYGAGIPELEEISGADFFVIDNCYIISNINRKLSSLMMAVGIIANHSFASAENSTDAQNRYEDILGEIFLTDYFPPQTSLIIECRKVNLIDYIIHKVRRF